MNNLQEFALSSNGDQWFVGSDEATGELFVLHRGNQPSGGHETRTAVQSFLKIEPHGPERAALIALLGTTEDHGDAPQDDRQSSV
jgi:hypothetical protein